MAGNALLPCRLLLPAPSRITDSFRSPLEMNVVLGVRSRVAWAPTPQRGCRVVRYSQHSVELILSILPQTTNQHVVKEFLRERGFPFSARSWQALVNDRLRPIVEARQIAMSDLFDLMRAAEEYGTQHIFLYRCARTHVSMLASPARIQRILTKSGLERLVQSPLMLEKPPRQTIADVRVSSSAREPALVAKAVQTRIRYDFLGESEAGGVLTKRWRRIEQRAVNVAQLHRDGLLEIRIASHHNSSLYRDDLNAFWDLIGSLLPPSRFDSVALTTAKRRIWDERKRLHHLIRFSESGMRNAGGIRLSAATGTEQGSLLDDRGADAGIQEFMKHGSVLCEKHNIWFKAGDGPIPTKDVHVLLAGEPHEFAITANCTRADHEYVVSQIRKHNR